MNNDLNRIFRANHFRKKSCPAPSWNYAKKDFRQSNECRRGKSSVMAVKSYFQPATERQAIDECKCRLLAFSESAKDIVTKFGDCQRLRLLLHKSKC